MKRRIFGIFLTLFASASLLLAVPLAASAAPAPTPTPTPAASDTAPQCDAGQAVFTWLICGAIRTIVSVVDWIRDNIIVPFLVEKPLDKADKDVAPVYSIWAAFRGIASVFFILIFFLVIFGTAIGWDNYTMKKILPRLVLGAVLVPFSWYVCVIIVDLGNILGQGLVAVTSSVIKPANIDFTSNLSKIFLGGAVALGVAGGATALATVSLGVLMSLLFAMLAVFFTLILRKIMITLLIVISPFAFLAWILPNTSKWFKEWWSNFFKLVMMYPVVMMLFEAGRLFAATAGATAGNAIENGVTPLFQIMGLMIPLFGVPFAFSWAGKGLKVGQNAIGKAAGAADKKWGKDSQGAKERAEARKGNNAVRALDPHNPLGSKTLGALKRAGALKRSGLGGFTSNVPVLGKIPVLSKPMTAAARQRLNSTAAHHEADEAQSEAQDKMRKEQPQSSHERIRNMSEAAFDKLEEARVVEAGRAVKTSSARGNSSDGVSLQDIDLGPAGIADIVGFITEAKARGDKATMIAGLRRLSQSSGGGVAAAQELAMGKIEELHDANGNVVGYKGGNGFNADGSKAMLGGDYTHNTSDEWKDVWTKGMKDAKGFDAQKPVMAGATDFSAEDLAGESHHAIKRKQAFYYQASRDTDPENARVAQAAVKGAQDFAQAAEGVAGSQILRGKISADAKGRVAKGGGVIIPKSPGADMAVVENTVPVVQPQVANAFASMVAATPPPPTVAPTLSEKIVAATGNDIVHASQIHQQIKNEIATSGSSTLKANLEGHVLQNNSLDAAALAAAGAPPARPMGPLTPDQAAAIPPDALNRHIATQFKDNLDAIHEIEHHYANDTAYRERVQQSFINGAPIPLPDNPPGP